MTRYRFLCFVKFSIVVKSLLINTSKSGKLYIKLFYYFAKYIFVTSRFSLTEGVDNLFNSLPKTTLFLKQYWQFQSYQHLLYKMIFSKLSIINRPRFLRSAKQLDSRKIELTRSLLTIRLQKIIGTSKRPEMNTITTFQMPNIYLTSA